MIITPQTMLPPLHSASLTHNAPLPDVPLSSLLKQTLVDADKPEFRSIGSKHRKECHDLPSLLSFCMSEFSILLRRPNRIFFNLLCDSDAADLCVCVCVLACTSYRLRTAWGGKKSTIPAGTSHRHVRSNPSLISLLLLKMERGEERGREGETEMYIKWR